MSRTKTTQNAQGNLKNNTTKCALFLFPVQHQAPASRFRTLLSASDQTLNTAATKMRCSLFLFARVGSYEKPCLHNAARRDNGNVQSAIELVVFWALEESFKLDKKSSDASCHNAKDRKRQHPTCQQKKRHWHGFPARQPARRHPAATGKLKNEHNSEQI